MLGEKTKFSLLDRQLSLASLTSLAVEQMDLKDGLATRWIRRCWLDGSIRRVAVNGSISKWKSVTNGVPQGLILGPILFNVFITDNGIESALNKFADNTKLNGALHTLEGRNVIQRSFDRLMNCMKFSEAECKILLHLDQGDHQH